ncbi:hypothetical protein GCM10011344_05910 [Dokdonia pacifica]|uniref:DUF4268 domain-containing protein n=1 Tax=Dokdonia pacifica TaxID=1627892 RepID=A0A238ZTG2_9FLAO|nr:hypothetical protein [Dokdonia pacifica]GGG08168.1 hypothetical protein GCM10011344_05910 [Dokdonia pacifica]SNR85953.1 hypothetical protein SAMN06265376_103459 [Dokdonia pacifica]
MERFSNSTEAYWNQIQKELLNGYDSKDFRFQYLEMGQLLSHGFSIAQTKRNSTQLIVKVWDAAYDNKRFSKRIFNLDRLAITDKKVELTGQELERINRLLNTKLDLTNWGGIVLDGLFCQFEINNKKMDWNVNEEINDNLTELVELLRSKVR